MRHALSALALLLSASLPLSATVVKQVLDATLQTGEELLSAPGFEATGGWQGWDQGFTLVPTGGRTGGAAMIRVTDLTGAPEHGASQSVRLDQTRPLPIVVNGYSRAEDVSGAPDSGYSIYLDLVFDDGTPLWGQISSFATGTHDWQRRQVVVVPTKPVREITVHALFRGHTGTVWFDDFSMRILGGEGMQLFDSVPVAGAAPEAFTASGESLAVSGGGATLAFDAATGAVLDRAGAARGGLFVRDVAAEGPFVRIDAPARAEGDVVIIEGEDAELGLGVRLEVGPEGESIAIRGLVRDLQGLDRAVTAYFSVPVDAAGWMWSDDMQVARRIEPGLTYFNGANVGAGLTGYASKYPLAALSGFDEGLALAVPLDEPRVCRLAYDSTSSELYAAFDLGLVPETERLPSAGDFALRLYAFDPEWQFRAALAHAYELFPEHFVRRALHEGIWMPFTDISTVQGHEDFGFAYKEGNDNVAWDDAHDILSFVYIEPMTNWMPMSEGAERSNENAIRLMEASAAAGNRQALATLSSGVFGADGAYDVFCIDAPWCDGAVFALNADPSLQAPPGGLTQWEHEWASVDSAIAADARSLPDWSLTYGGSVVEEPGRGKVLQLQNTTVGADVRASQTLVFDPPTDQPLIIGASGRAISVTGEPSGQYSVYADITYSDGTNLFGEAAPFPTGDSPWTTVERRIVPTKPVSSVSLNLLLRFQHTGTALVDDVFVRLEGFDENLCRNAGFEGTEGPAAVLDGTYIDSLEGWSDRPNYRREHFGAADVPLTFSTTDRVPVLMTFFSTYEATRELSARMHEQGKLLMANATPIRFPWAAHALDVMGIETNWAPGGQWQPDSHATFAYRRALCYQKPYLLLQNTVYDQFPIDMVERYFARSIAYGVFPSFFSHNAADDPYWRRPDLYNAHRELFKQYIPVCQRISAAGWEPITHAFVLEEDVLVERFGNAADGDLHFSVFNDSDEPRSIRLEPNLTALGLEGPIRVEELVAGRELVVTAMGQVLLELGPEEVAVVTIR